MSTNRPVTLASESVTILSESEQKPVAAPEIGLRLTCEEADLVLRLVSIGQYWQVAALVQKLVAQIEPQVQEQDLKAQLSALPADALGKA